MRSGNGRHRRPRQAPAIVVAAGVTGSAIAIPLLGATSASAADAATWDRVADCESGGMWSADLGNGFYGGLQISQETWSDFGGTAYAPTADQASRSQQIAVAEKILAAQGPTAWPTCALITGLTADAGTAPDAGAAGDATQKPETPPEPEPTETAVLPPAPESAPPPVSSAGTPPPRRPARSRARNPVRSPVPARASTAATRRPSPASPPRPRPRPARVPVAAPTAPTAPTARPRRASPARRTKSEKAVVMPHGVTVPHATATPRTPPPTTRTPSAPATTCGPSPASRRWRVAGPRSTRRTARPWARTPTSSCRARTSI